MYIKKFIQNVQYDLRYLCCIKIFLYSLQNKVVIVTIKWDNDYICENTNIRNTFAAL